jgi:Mg2+ and Co2+ transporter CorA
VISDLTALGERIKLLQEEIAAKVNEQTNRTLFTLTVVTVLALPINIIAGFFGMNVGGVPLAENPMASGCWLPWWRPSPCWLGAGRFASAGNTKTGQAQNRRTD